MDLDGRKLGAFGSRVHNGEMSQVVAVIEVLALLGLAPGFVGALAAAVLRRPLDNLSRPLQRLPAEQFRNAIMLPLISVYAGAIAGVGTNLLTTEPDRYLYAFAFMLVTALVVVMIGGRLAVKPIRRVAGTAVAYRRELLAEMLHRDWTSASREDRVAASRRAARLAATGLRLVSYARTRSFGQWLRRRPRLELAWFATATAVTTAVLLYVLVVRVVTGGGTIGPGLLLIVLLPTLGPGQLWLRYRENRATLRAFGAELHSEASAVLTAIAAAPPPPFRLRLLRSLRTLLDLDPPGHRRRPDV
ncbi:hypothetical protein [Micromonospora sp. WMMA1996]|uniref:hypothetical protein n=1 Tax=Micromonospora sp. WMMA1996 TaxID=2039878 RepID=UPI001145FACD|nr:hypothetical protein [Micromonospora sp. WMMA1996]